jgi:cytochrome c-type biogenesis protein CcmH/NrfF
MKAFLVAVLICLFSALPSLAHAHPEGDAIELSEQIMSPYCPGVTLHECPSSEAIEMRERIEGWLAAGWSEEAVMSELERQFGPSIRARPPTEGAGLAAWLVPILIAGGGLLLVGFLVRSWLKFERSSPEGPPLSHEESTRLNAELEALRQRR